MWDEAKSRFHLGQEVQRYLRPYLVCQYVCITICKALLVWHTKAEYILTQNVLIIMTFIVKGEAL